MPPNEILMVLATLTSPLFAVQVTRYLDHRRERRDRRMAVFRTLMGTRSRRLSQDHVEALNVIDVEFGERSSRDRKVIDAWKIYLDHLNKPVDEGWVSRSDELFGDLLFSMADSLGYDFDKVHIRKQWYVPKAQADLENDQFVIRKGVLSVLNGDKILKIQTATASIEVAESKGATAADAMKAAD